MNATTRYLLATLCFVALYLAVSAASTTAHAAPGAHGPGGEHLDAPTAASGSGLARLPDGSVNIPKLAQRRLEIRTQLAPLGDAAATAELAARVVIDPNTSGRVQPVLSGRIEPGPGGLATAGQRVTRGQVLAYVRPNPDPYARANQQAQLTELRVARGLAEQKLKRLESLAGTVPAKTIEAARAELESFSERERGIGASLTEREALVAPVSGVIARADALAGQVVAARDVLFEIVDPGRVLIEATTPDPMLASRIASAHLVGHPTVKLTLIGAARSLRDGVLPITFRAVADPPNAPLPIAIGQPLTIITSFRERMKGIVLPAQAMVRDAANESVVWIKVSAERYVAQPVRFQSLDARTVVITSGLAPDNRVVVQGAPLIAQIR